MADQEKSNINSEYNNAVSGLDLDNTVNQIQKGKLTYALNSVIENFDSNSVNYQNEQGNEFCLKFPDDYLLMGKYFITEQSKHIFFLTNPLTGDSEIGYMINNDCVYRKLINAVCLNFNINYPIHKVVHRITNRTTEIYWTDGFNSRRYLDLENIPYKLTLSSDLCDPTFSNDLDCNQLKIQPNFNIPKVNIDKISSGGDLKAGVYQFAVQYSDPVGNGYTSYYSVTNPTPIADLQITSVNFNYPVGKSITVDVSNLDVTGQFQYFNLAVIKTINNISSVELIGTYFIEEDNRQVTYTGQLVDNIRLSINDIFEKFPYYDIAQDVTAVQDILVWDDLTSVDRINYQSIANKITLNWETHRIPDTENYADELNATNLRSYLRDEVYAFEIVFLLKNGKQTDGFHIPGRVKNANETSQPDILKSNPDFVGDGNSAPYWQIYNTASLTGFSPEYTPALDYKGPYQFGEFAYWESIEEYPCNQELWGDLSGQPIRHHKFPDVLVSPIMESKQYNGKLEMGDVAVFPIGVKLDVSQVSGLIAGSNLTTEQKEEISAFKIIRSSRGTNKSIVAKGLLRNVGKYEREGQTYYFPNYPYNDLNEDPFLNSINNAWSQQCEQYTIEFYQGTPFNNNLSTIDIEFTSCNNNKTGSETLQNPGFHTVCSTSTPIFTTPGNYNKVSQTSNGPVALSSVDAIVYPSSYDVWKVTWAVDIAAGATVTWFDSVMGTQSTQLAGPTYFLQGETITVRVPRGQSIQCSVSCVKRFLGSDKAKLKFTQIERVEVTDCSEETALSPIKDDVDSSYRQVFNSPETSFGQPFLGDILKLENVVYGGGKAHFVEVKKNAKYKLLTAEAQKDALNSSRGIADITDPFSSAALFAAYQSYLTIYVNGITRKNYAYSYNSIADYNHAGAIPNSGNKQRQIDFTKYLVPTVQSVGDEDGYNLNNYQRETSVFIKTIEERDNNPVSSLSFPSNFTPAGVEDKSRTTVSENKQCSSPEKEDDISVVSYYGSMKNIFLNQYGQIYSYSTVDTGFQFFLDDKNNKTVTVFGGDTFISRFSFKTKLPFFIDNRVEAPDDSDIFYDEIGNIAYPKYWHSARSILEDYTVSARGDGGHLLSNFISYKAHNFDCPNSQEVGPPLQNPDRTYYDGYYYLFAYGVPYFYCESSYNTDLRQAFNDREGEFWPHVTNGIPDDWVQESLVSIANDNTYHYNVTFSKLNIENSFTNLPQDWKEINFTNYPFRAIYSDLQSTDADNRVNNWLIYRPVSYFDFPQNYGKLNSLDGIQNQAILARFENKSLMYNNLLTIDTTNPQAAYIGNSNLFKGAPPIDFAETDLGYVGSQNKILLKIPQGQITIDAKRGQVFLIQGTQVTDLTAFGSGMNRFFTDQLPFNILNYFPDINTDNHYFGIGLHGIYDSKYERIILTKLDYVPLSSDIKYDDVTKEFYTEKQINNIVIQNQVYLSDINYFCNKSWTVSFNFNTKSWVSFHSYLPNFYIAENNFFYSGLNACCSDDFEALVGTFVDYTTTTTSSTTKYPFPTTTTTTTAGLDCELDDATFTETNCDLEGNGIITVPPTTTTTICARPDGLPRFRLFSGYSIDSVLTNTTVSKETACEGITVYEESFEDPLIYFLNFTVNVASLSIGEIVYYNADSTDCILAPDGWYFTDGTAIDNTVFHIESGYITEIELCALPPCAEYTLVNTGYDTFYVTYVDCVIEEEFVTTVGVGEIGTACSKGLPTIYQGEGTIELSVINNCTTTTTTTITP